MRKLSEDYTAEIDSVDKDSWFEIIKKFDDANIYQTWCYDAVRCGRNNISHLILKKNGAIVAVAQARIVKLPLVSAGIAYVRWGPLWRLCENATDLEVFSQTIRALRNEYACRRGLLLRLFPVLFTHDSDTFLPILDQEGFSWFARGKRERTLIIDLSPSLEDLRKGLKQKWRNCLNRAEKNKLEVIDGYDDELFETFMGIYKEMIDRKQFIEPNDINDFLLIQKDLPENFKMKIMLCRFDGELCVGAIFSAIGKTGIYLFGATNKVGLKSNGSYLLQWNFIEWLKDNHYVWYDLNGINPERNPGTYRFKAGLCGKNGTDVYFLGQFETDTNFFSRLSVRIGQKLKSGYQSSKAIISNSLSRSR